MIDIQVPFCETNYFNYAIDSTHPESLNAVVLASKISIGEYIIILSAYTLQRHLEQYFTQSSIISRGYLQNASLVATKRIRVSFQNQKHWKIDKMMYSFFFFYNTFTSILPQGRKNT